MIRCLFKLVLGCRMARAARRALSDPPLNNHAELEDNAPQQVLLVGTDCPLLSPELLAAAAQRLTEQDALLHPTEDGGYVLLGLRQFSDNLFNNIPWSTHTVAALTQKRLSQLGWRYRVAERLLDIDEPADLFWLTSSWRQVITEHSPP